VSDYDELMRAYSAIARDNERRAIKKSLRTIKAARKAGLPIKAAVVEGTELQSGQPEAAAATFNEWDEDLGTNSLKARQ
jgi:hypothetical protein